MNKLLLSIILTSSIANNGFACRTPSLREKVPVFFASDKNVIHDKRVFKRVFRYIGEESMLSSKHTICRMLVEPDISYFPQVHYYMIENGSKNDCEKLAKQLSHSSYSVSYEENEKFTRKVKLIRPLVRGFNFINPF